MRRRSGPFVRPVCLWLFLVVLAWSPVLREVSGGEPTEVPVGHAGTGIDSTEVRRCGLQLVFSQDYTLRDSSSPRLLTVWRGLEAGQADPSCVHNRPVVGRDVASRGWLVVDGPIHSPLQRIVWYKTNGFSIPDLATAAAAVLENDIYFFSYLYQRNVSTNILVFVLPGTLGKEGDGLGRGFAIEGARFEGVQLPRLRVPARSSRSSRVIDAESIAGGILVSLVGRDSGNDLLQYVFRPEEPRGCGKWFKVIGEKRVRIRFNRPLGAPEEEFDYIRRMEALCDDF